MRGDKFGTVPVNWLFCKNSPLEEEEKIHNHPPRIHSPHTEAAGAHTPNCHYVVTPTHCNFGTDVSVGRLTTFARPVPLTELPMKSSRLHATHEGVVSPSPSRIRPCMEKTRSTQMYDIFLSLHCSKQRRLTAALTALRALVWCRSGCCCSNSAPSYTRPSSTTSEQRPHSELQTN